MVLWVILLWSCLVKNKTINRIEITYTGIKATNVIALKIRL